MVALSSAEVEYIAISTAEKDIIHLWRFFTEFKHNKPITEVSMSPTVLYTDSTSAISLIEIPKISERNKHIDTKSHHIKQLVQ